MNQRSCHTKCVLRALSRSQAEWPKRFWGGVLNQHMSCKLWQAEYSVYGNGGFVLLSSAQFPFQASFSSASLRAVTIVNHTCSLELPRCCPWPGFGFKILLAPDGSSLLHENGKTEINGAPTPGRPGGLSVFVTFNLRVQLFSRYSRPRIGLCVPGLASWQLNKLGEVV